MISFFDEQEVTSEIKTDFVQDLEMNQTITCKEYWEPYLNQLIPEEDYWFEDELTNMNTLKILTPFISAPYDLDVVMLRNFMFVECAISRKSDFEKLIISKDIKTVLTAFFYVEKHSRRNYLLNKFLKTELSTKFSDKKIWDLIIDIWSSSEYNCTHEIKRIYWNEIFEFRKRPISMIKKLPESFEIYRGGIKEGYSWTRDIEIAKWFQNRTSINVDNSFLMKMTVKKDDVLFFRDGESEVVVSHKALDSYWNSGQIEILDIKTEFVAT